MLKPPCRELNAVSARDPFSPTSQSLSDRHIAASASGIICWSSRSRLNAVTIAPSVIDCIHIRWSGLSTPASAMM